MHRGSFSEDWARAVGAPILSRIAITSADPGGLLDAVKAWGTEVRAKVAGAGTDGGFRGFGGEKVSAAERAALDRLGNALG